MKYVQRGTVAIYTICTDKEVSEVRMHEFGGRVSLYIQSSRARVSQRTLSNAAIPKTKISAGPSAGTSVLREKNCGETWRRRQLMAEGWNVGSQVLYHVLRSMDGIGSHGANQSCARMESS